MALRIQASLRGSWYQTSGIRAFFLTTRISVALTQELTGAVVRPGTDTYCNYAIIEALLAI